MKCSEPAGPRGLALYNNQWAHLTCLIDNDDKVKLSFLFFNIKFKFKNAYCSIKFSFSILFI